MFSCLEELEGSKSLKLMKLMPIEPFNILIDVLIGQKNEEDIYSERIPKFSQSDVINRQKRYFENDIELTGTKVSVILRAPSEMLLEARYWSDQESINLCGKFAEEIVTTP